MSSERSSLRPNLNQYGMSITKLLLRLKWKQKHVRSTHLIKIISGQSVHVIMALQDLSLNIIPLIYIKLNKSPMDLTQTSSLFIKCHLKSMYYLARKIFLYAINRYSKEIQKMINGIYFLHLHLRNKYHLGALSTNKMLYILLKILAISACFIISRKSR